MRHGKKNTKKAESIIQAIEDRIVSGIYLPGKRLDEISLANEFSVSRTPVREALSQLHAHCLIDNRPRRGAIVVEVSPHRVFQMFEVMAELEAMCVKLAARRHDDSDLRAIRVALEACDKARELDDFDLYYDENTRFHHAIYAASHNRFLHDKLASFYKRLGVYRRFKLRTREQIKKSGEEHVLIIEALVAGNAVLAAERICRHVALHGEFFLNLPESFSKAMKLE